MTKGTQEGGCACGAIRYAVRGKAESSMLCHCRTCRSVSGAPVVGWVTFARADFELLRGEPARFSTSPPVVRTFCGHCGTPLSYTHEMYPDTLDVPTCTLDDPDAFPPTHHSWLSHDLRWLRFGDGLPAYPESRSG